MYINLHITYVAHNNQALCQFAKSLISYKFKKDLSLVLLLSSRR